MIFDFLVYAEAQRQRDVLSTQRLIEGQASAAESENARKEAEELISKQIGNKEIPVATMRFLNEAWSNVLYLSAIKFGNNSELHQHAETVVQDIISTTYSAEGFETRTDLLVKLPILLKVIREGLSSIEMSPVLMNQMFSDLEVEHKRVIAEIDNSEINDEVLNDCREKAKATVIEFKLKPDEEANKAEVEETTAELSAQIEDENFSSRG